MPITLPLESTIILRKDGSSSVQHTTLVSGEAGQAFVEASVELMGGSVNDLVKAVDEAAKNENGRTAVV